MAVDTSFYQRAPANVELDPLKAMTENLNFRMLREKAAMNQMFLNEELTAAMQANQKAKLTNSIEADKEAARQEWKKLLPEYKTEDGKIDYSAAYQAGLRRGLRTDVVTELREGALKTQQQEISNAKTLEDEIKRLGDTMVLEVRASKTPEQFQGTMRDYANRFGRLGMPRADIERLFNDRFGVPVGENGEPLPPELVMKKAQAAASAWADATITPLQREELTLQQQQLKLAQSAEGRALVEQRTAGALTQAEALRLRDKFRNGAAAASELLKIGSTKLGSLTGNALEEFVLQSPQGARTKAALDAYNAKNGTNYTIGNEGLPRIQQLLSDEAKSQDRVVSAVDVKAATPTGRAAPPAPQAAALKKGDIVTSSTGAKKFEYIGPPTTKGSAEAKNPKNYREIK